MSYFRDRAGKLWDAERDREYADYAPPAGISYAPFHRDPCRTILQRLLLSGHSEWKWGKYVDSYVDFFLQKSDGFLHLVFSLFCSVLPPNPSSRGIIPTSGVCRPGE